MFIADTLALSATPVFEHAAVGAPLTFGEAWCGVLAYTFQIYFDFSAYSEMAIGLARMFGLQLPQNFASPYKSRSIAEFWRRWHITLSRFLKDYLYIPLGGNRKGYLRQKINVFVTMLLGGIWHGAGWTFMIWGAMHGVFLIINHLWNETMKQRVDIPVPLAWGLTFLCAVFAWVPFRAESLQTTLDIWHTMIGLDGFALAGFMGRIITKSNAVLLAVCFILSVFAPNVPELFRKKEGTLSTDGYVVTQTKPSRLQWSANAMWALGIGLLFWLCLLKLNDPSEFLYFQF